MNHKYEIAAVVIVLLAILVARQLLRSRSKGKVPEVRPWSFLEQIEHETKVTLHQHAETAGAKFRFYTVIIETGECAGTHIVRQKSSEPASAEGQHILMRELQDIEGFSLVPVSAE